MENTKTEKTVEERRVYKREGFVHITFKSTYFAPSFNVTNLKVGQRTLCQLSDDGELLVDAGNDNPVERWAPIAKSALGKPVRKPKPVAPAPEQPKE